MYIVNTRFNSVHHTSLFNALYEEPVARGCGQVSGRGRSRGRGNGRVTPPVNEIPMDTV